MKRSGVSDAALPDARRGLIIGHSEHAAIRLGPRWPLFQPPGIARTRGLDPRGRSNLDPPVQI
jgi:hypothetical protein